MGLYVSWVKISNVAHELVGANVVVGGWTGGGFPPVDKKSSYAD